jgi:hypothetical protein
VWYSTKETEEGIWALIERGGEDDSPGADGPSDRAADPTHTLPEQDRDDDEEEKEEEEEEEERGTDGATVPLLGRSGAGAGAAAAAAAPVPVHEVIPMVPVATAGTPLPPAGASAAAARLRTLSQPPGGAAAPPQPHRRAVFYRVSKRTSTVAFLERIFENELDRGRLPGPPPAPEPSLSRPAADDHAPGTNSAAARASPPPLL